MNIGEKIKYLRKSRDMSQEKFAEYFNITPQAVSKWENGAAYPDITIIPAIAVFFGISIDELFDFDKTKLDKLSMKYRIATDTATTAGKYNDTPALNSSLNWAAGADAAEVKIL